MDRLSERTLIRSAAAGDRAAAAMLIRHHQKSLYAYILRMCGKPETAEDVVQEAFVRVLTNLDRFDERYRFSTWAFTIARRLYLNQVQKMRPVFDSETVGSAEAAGRSVYDPEGEAELGEARSVAHDALQRALLQLSPDQREAVVLFHQSGWPIALIAQQMDIPEGTVKSHLHRGRRKLRELMLADESSADRLELLGAALENKASENGAVRELDETEGGAA